MQKIICRLSHQIQQIIDCFSGVSQRPQSSLKEGLPLPFSVIFCVSSNVHIYFLNEVNYKCKFITFYDFLFKYILISYQLYDLMVSEK